ncbi:MAG TPA: SDR family NAD(P)-dependent oxidoreductase [Hanamia sp.]|jgi:3-hydroxy acid dehydrogenase / malonic semialdehyde reductase|nr:SDR family NAD(P)-dependent oxidoreductase [Hanamia sp.]
MKRIVFITGATSGIGNACAEKFAANGDDLIINGRRNERLEEIKKTLEQKYNTEVFCASFDVQNKEEVFQAIEQFPEKWKSVDVLINSAGLALGRDLFDEAEIEDWDTMIQTNINGLLYVSKAVIPFMMKKNTGHIINIGSTAGDVVYERGNIYCASKSAVEAISHGMRIDLLRHHIKVTNIKPGAVETEFSVVRFKGDEEKADKVYEGFAPLTATDIADSIFYCASLPPNVCINDLTITPTAQADGIYIYKGRVNEK